MGFLLVLAPEHPAVSEALYFFDRLAQAGLTLDAFVANRVLPAPPLADLAELRAHLQAQPQLRSWPTPEREAAIDLFGGAAGYLARTARSQRRELDRLAERAPRVPVLDPALRPRSLQPVRATRDRRAARGLGQSSSGARLGRRALSRSQRQTKQLFFQSEHRSRLPGALVVVAEEVAEAVHRQAFQLGPELASGRPSPRGLDRDDDVAELDADARGVVLTGQHLQVKAQHVGGPVVLAVLAIEAAGSPGRR